MFLSNLEFANVISKTPMIAIDLCIVKDLSVLLGKRINPPAKNYYFVPGGRIRKSETIKNALSRIIYNETGRTLKKLKNLKFVGIFEHFYDDNFLGNFEFDTHYLVLTYKVHLEDLSEIDPKFINNQHSEYIWYEYKKKDNDGVHKYTIAYFDKL